MFVAQKLLRSRRPPPSHDGSGLLHSTIGTPSLCPKSGGTTPTETYGKASELFFRQVYGTGKNNDTPARYSFIELFNSS